MKRNFKIIGLIVALSISVLLACNWIAQPKAQASWTTLRVRSLADASSNFFRFYTNWPGSLDDFDPASANNLRKAVFIDPNVRTTNDGWGNPIIYRPFDPSVGYGSVISYGRDAKPGGVGFDADVEVQFGLDDL